MPVDLPARVLPFRGPFVGFGFRLLSSLLFLLRHPLLSWGIPLLASNAFLVALCELWERA